MEKILEIHDYFINNAIRVNKERLNKVVGNYSFYYCDTKLNFGQNENQIYQRIKESSVIIIGLYTEVESKKNNSYFIIGYEKTIICVKVSLLHLLNSLFSYNNDLNILFLFNAKDIFNKCIKIK